jgi:dihydroorotase
METLTITRPDDWHLHVRDGDALKTVIPHTAQRFSRAIIMPNLNPPITTANAADEYRERILQAVPDDCNFTPLMTLYLTDTLSPDEIRKAKDSPHVYAAKLYPAGATTHSDKGVTNIKNIYPVLESMQEVSMPLLIHGESTDTDVDVFEREKRFIEDTLTLLCRDFPALRIVLEHITTRDAVQFIESAKDNLAATVTAHHLLMNRNAMFMNGIRPHHYCLPVLKHEQHRKALLEAATGGNRKFFLGTDSAPHPRNQKESACGCAGIYTAHAAIELYAEAFEQAGKLDKLESFASHHGADFYGLPRNSETITLVKTSWTVPESYEFSDDLLIPLRAGEDIHWKIQDA